MLLAVEQTQQLHTVWSEALATQAFKRRRITQDHLHHALPVATQRSFQRLIQALFREALLNADNCQFARLSHCSLVLEDGKTLCFEHLRAGRMNSWELRGAVTLHCPDKSIQTLVFPSQLLTLLGPLFQPAASSAVLQRLAEELDNSLMNDTLCLAFHQGWTLDLKAQAGGREDWNYLAWLKDASVHSNPTVLLEQWGTLGHPWHPNYKTKLGLSTSQLIELSPEFEASIEIVLCAMHRECAHVEVLLGTGDYWSWWQAHFPQAALQLSAEIKRRGLERDDYLPLPAHPWQVSDVLLRMFASQIADKQLLVTDIVAFTAHPTMSFRTVVPEGRDEAPMVKLPVAIRLTSVQRTVSPRSARMGPRVSQLVLNILDKEPQIQRLLNIVPERVGVHYAPLPADDECSRHAGVLYRDSLSGCLQPGELAVPVGSLFALDEHQEPLLRQWVRLAQGRDDSDAMHDFYRDYLAIAVPSLLGIYLLYGVAFEAHQQNSFMVMTADGQLSRLLIRDFGDIRIDRHTLHCQGLDIELHDPGMTLFDRADYVRDKLLHTTFMCHLGELTLLCARHWQVPQALLWDQLAVHVSHCFDTLRERVEPRRWQTERQALLEHDWPAKSFMRMRLLDSHADIVGRLANPLRGVAYEG